MRFTSVICTVAAQGIRVAIIATTAFAEPEQLPTFGDTINILGAMERTDQDFQDGLALDLFSPNNHTLVVLQNLTPLSGQFVSGSSGEGFIALSSYSYIITMSESPNDLIAKIEIPYDTDILAQKGIQESNTYVGTLAADGKSWIIDESARNVHRSENNTRIIKMTSLDGEYILLGRTSVDTSNIFVQYGQGATRTVNVTASGRQEAEFVDGLRFSMISDQDFTMNAELRNGIAPQSLPPGMVSVNSFTWVVNTSNPSVNAISNIYIPVNVAMIETLHTTENAGSVYVMAAKKGLDLADEEPFEIITSEDQTLYTMSGNYVQVTGAAKLDGEYILVTKSGT